MTKRLLEGCCCGHRADAARRRAGAVSAEETTVPSRLGEQVQKETLAPQVHRPRRENSPNLRGCLGLGLMLAAGANCGSRTALELPPPLPPAPECDVDEDCPGVDDLCEPVRCVDASLLEEAGLDPAEIPDLVPPRVCLVLDPVECDDNDPCTAERCDAATGACIYEPATLDLDGDGFRAPLIGVADIPPGACGSDCNDASPDAFPGGTEVCDGVDNDCNGVVDDGAEFLPAVGGAVTQLSAEEMPPTGSSGLAFDGERFSALFTGRNGTGSTLFLSQIDEQGAIDVDATNFVPQNGDASGGRLVWVGDRYGVAWQDRRSGDYEVYFTILRPDGEKALPDVRLTFAEGFSINTRLTWTGNEFVVTWQDERNGQYDVLAQRVAVDGTPIDGNRALITSEFFDDESPAVAAGDRTLALVYTNRLGPGEQRVRFQLYDLATYEPLLDEPLQLNDGVTDDRFPTVVWNEDRYLVAWFDNSGSPRAIYATAIDEDGRVLVSERAVSSPPGGSRSRYPAILPLGDRALFVYSDNRDRNDGYELYSRTLSRDLVPLSDEQRITDAPFNSRDPQVAFGADGNVGILFLDERLNGADHTWFTQLGCVAQP